MAFAIIRNDITKVAADALVNTANPRPTVGGGTDTAVYRAAGKRRLLAERKKIGDIAPGQAVATPAFRLPAKYILHTVSPAWIDGNHGERETLRACYANALALAEHLGCESVAFPLLAAGSCGFPKDEALSIALSEIGRFLLTHEMTVTLVVFDPQSVALAAALTEGIEQFIDDRTALALRQEEYGPQESRRFRSAYGSGQSAVLSGNFAPSPQKSSHAPRRSFSDINRNFASDRRETEEKRRPREAEDEAFALREAWGASPEETFPVFEEKRSSAEENVSFDSLDAPLYHALPEKQPSPPASAASAPMPAAFFTPAAPTDRELEEVLQGAGETFQQKLFELIDASGMDDVTVYKKANIDRKVFSRIRCKADYRPKKKTAVAFAIALELDMPAMLDLLARAEIAFSPSSKFDLIVTYFITHRIYDIFEINAALFKYGQPILGE